MGPYLVMLPFFFAAALMLPMEQKTVTPGFGKRVVIKTQATLTGKEKPGEFQVRVFKNNAGNAPGQPVENVRITPRVLYLREKTATRLTLSIDSAGLKPGPLWICITEKEPTASVFSPSGGGQLRVRTQSCYQRILRTRN